MDGEVVFLEFFRCVLKVEALQVFPVKAENGFFVPGRELVVGWPAPESVSKAGCSFFPVSFVVSFCLTIAEPKFSTGFFQCDDFFLYQWVKGKLFLFFSAQCYVSLHRHLLSGGAVYLLAAGSRLMFSQRGHFYFG